jgi:hypothetical protein
LIDRIAQELITSISGSAAFPKKGGALTRENRHYMLNAQSGRIIGEYTQQGIYFHMKIVD